MSIGTRKQVQIIPYTSTQNATGSSIETQGTKVGVWADISNPSGFRAYLNGQTQLGATKDFLIRYRFDLVPNVNWRIMYEGKLWTVTDKVQLKEKRFYYRLTATSKSDV